MYSCLYFNLRPHQCPQTLTVWWRDFLCSMVECIDYGQKASPSKARHEHSVIREWRRVLCCRAGCWCQQGHSHPLVIQLRPTPIPNHVAVLTRVFHSRSIDYERKTHLKRWWHEESSIRPTSVRMELNAPFSQEWAFCIDDTSLLSPLAARWFGIISPSTVVTDFLSGILWPSSLIIVFLHVVRRI